MKPLKPYTNYVYGIFMIWLHKWGYYSYNRQMIITIMIINGAWTNYNDLTVLPNPGMMVFGFGEFSQNSLNSAL